VIEAVVFDWGGTITTYHSVDMIDAWRVAAAVLAPDRVDEVAEALLAAERDFWARTETTMESATTADVLRAASDAVQLPVDEALHLDAVESYLNHWAPTTIARRDARRVMHALRDLGLAIGLLSNTHWPRAQHEEWLARDGLIDLIDARVYTSDLSHMKPHPDAFKAVLDELHVAAERTVFVGDRLMDDIFGAKQLGMRAVWMRNDAVPSFDVVPDAVIDELSELPDIVKAWR
jgi:putative hydrolase of the HAD superfamily